MKSCLYEGRVEHRRFSPVENRFSYSLFMAYLDLDELPGVFDGRWLWSARRRAPAWFRRADHMGDPARPLAECVRALVAERTGDAPEGPIRLLTHLRYFGYCFNPVSFYYCFDARDERVQAIVAEVNNTPWGERYCYVLRAHDAQDDGGIKRYALQKAFHVSPFMPMDMRLDWRFGDPGERLSVYMQNIHDERKVFDATLALERRPLDGRSLARALVVHPPMTLKVIALIYAQALRLWLKGAPFHEHPRNKREGGALEHP